MSYWDCLFLSRVRSLADKSYVTSNLRSSQTSTLTVVALGVFALVLEAVLRGSFAFVGVGLAGLVTCGTIFIGIRTHIPTPPRGWGLLALCAITLAGGWGLMSLSALQQHLGLYVIPSFLIVIGCSSLAGAITLFARRQHRAWDQASLVEVAMVVASVAAPTVALLVLPDLGLNDVPLPTLLVGDLAPLMVITTAVVLLRLTLWSRSRSTSNRLLLSSFALVALSSVLLALSDPPHLELSSLTLIVGLILLGLASLRPSMTELTEPVPTRHEVDGTGFAVIALFVPIITMVVRWTLSDRFDFETFLTIEVVITALVIWRLRLLFRAMEHARRTSEMREQYYRAILDNVADLIVALDSSGRATYISPSAHEILGKAPAELLGGVALDTVHPDDQEFAAALIAQALSTPGRRVAAELRAIAADGTTRLLSGSATSLDGDHGDAALVIGMHDVTEQKRLEEELAHRAMHDEMTGLPNRALIMDRCEQLLARAMRTGNQIAVLFVDLDDFKDVNDGFGHATGDALLVAVAARLSTAIRANDTIGRVGGDEFVVLTEHIPSGPGPELVAERILELMREPFHLETLESVSLSVTASIGIATGPRALPAELLRDADVALYRAKALGKARYVSFQPEMFSAVKNRLELERDLRGALESGQFFLLYQPTVDLSTLEITGVEALIRWRHPTRGVVSPIEFIPVLEESGSIVEVGRWVLRQACTQAAVWQQRGHSLSMSVNVSARQLESDGLIDDVREALETSALRPNLLTLEITETTLMRDADKTADRLEHLRGLGVRIAIDDFGTGYCSLSYLRRFPIDVLKIDRSFVSGLSESEDARALVRTLVRLGKDLGLRTLAEGIEDDEQLAELRKEHCEAGQGFLFARPLDPSALDDLLESHRLLAALTTTSA